MKKFSLLILCGFLMGSLYAQERPRVEKSAFVNAGQLEKSDQLLIWLDEADSMYKKELFHEAFLIYQKLFDYVATDSALNYRLGVSALMSGYPASAVQYLEISDPAIAYDYYYLLGRAYQLNQQYSQANVAYGMYDNSLHALSRRHFSVYYQQLTRECQYGIEAIKDSLPYFIINLGEAVNSVYDDYAPVLFPGRDAMYYTTRQPLEPLRKPVKLERLDENVKFSKFDVNGSTVGTFLTGISLRRNVSVAGADAAFDRIFLYKGKNRSGSVYSAITEEDFVARLFRMKGRIDKKFVKEGYFSVAENGQGVFSTNRWDSRFGEDLVFADKVRFRRVKNAYVADDNINTLLDEKSAVLTPDGQTLYFASNGHEGFGGFDIYRSNLLEDGSWSMPQNLGYPINTPANELYYFPTSDSLVALVASDRAGGMGGLDIYKIIKDIRIPFDLWGEVVDAENGNRLKALLTVVDNATGEPLVSAVSDSLSGEYFIHLEDAGDFSVQAQVPGYAGKIERIETPTERNFRLRKDFQLARLASPFTMEGWVRNEANGAPVQAEIVFKQLANDSVVGRGYTNGVDGTYNITLDDKRNMVMEVNANKYFPYTDTLMLRDHRQPNFRKDVLLKRSQVSYTLAGHVTEVNTNQSVAASLAFYEPAAEAPFLTAFSDTLTGKYAVTLEKEGPFIVEVNAEGYFFVNMPLVFNEDSTLLIRNVAMQKMAAGTRIVVENILFNSGKATLKAESYSELNKLVRLLLENSSVRIEVSGHTDNVGSASLNKRLSRSRAESVKNYLQSHGVDAGRIEFQGYGFDRPIAPNDTPEGRAANRRVEIEVLD
jgi:outer membrane protein OmpA-like peptidoglycan-associated protein